MKNKVAFILGVVLFISSVITGCGGKDESVKTGLAVVAALGNTADASAEAEGIAQTDATIAAVTVDKDGKVVACKIDAAQTKINFSEAGAITSDMKGEYLTKQELGTEYGMHAISPIGKEWYEQADAFAEYCVGKTAEEIQGMSISEEHVTDEDLKASVTISVAGLQAAVVKAIENATEGGAKVGDKIGLGAVTEISDSMDATEETEGLAQTSTTISVVTLDDAGKITSSILDAYQTKVNFDSNGKITSDASVAVQTKNELKESYGMKAISPIGKEWYEQAAAYAKYSVGKTAEDVNATALTEGKVADADLAASVTIHVTGFNKVISKAAANAKE